MLSNLEENYEKEKREFFVLTSRFCNLLGIAYYKEPIYLFQTHFLAILDVKTNELRKYDGRLICFSSNKDLVPMVFKELTIYRIKARRFIKEIAKISELPSLHDSIFVTKILKEDENYAPLKQILKKYKEPTILQDEILGKLELCKDKSQFEGNVIWLGRKINITFEVDKYNESTWTKAIKMIKEIYINQEKLDKQMREFAANKLTSLTHEQLKQEDKNSPKTSKEDFKKTINLIMISLSSDENFTAYYEAIDRLYAVEGSLKNGITNAYIQEF